MPPEHLQPLMHSIESVTIKIHNELSQITDNDVEWVYEKLLLFYKKKISNADLEEPLSSIDRRQVLLDEVLNIIDEREQIEADSPFVNNPDFTNGGSVIPSLELLYTLAFKTLRNSVRFWRKKSGSKGYLEYVKEFL